MEYHIINTFKIYIYINLLFKFFLKSIF